MTAERRGLPEKPSETGEPIIPSSMMTNTASTSKPSSAIHVHVQSEDPQKQQVVNPSHGSIAYLRNLSDSLSAFQRCFGELHQHIDSIRTTIDSVLPKLTTSTPPLPPSPPPVAVSPVLEPESSDPSEEEEEEEQVQSPCGEEVQSYESEEVESYYSEEVKSPRGEEVKSPDCSQLKSLCELMNGRGLRRYLVMHLSDTNRLLEEVPKALRLSRDPPRLVLECMGKFYRQGSNSYAKGSHMVRGRQAAVLVLECFLLMRMDGVEIDRAVKEDAEKAALEWRMRLIVEGGVQKAYEMDAKGLLLLIGCFGIPGRFTNEDIRYLLLRSRIRRISGALRRSSGYLRRISGALRRSSFLMAKIPEIIEGMVKQNMEIDAVHIAFTFGIEDRFNPQRLLTSFLLDSKESLKKMKSQGSLAAVHEAKRNHLFALKSVIKCLELHNIDPSKLLPAWKINEKIMALEKEIGGFDKQIGKRMAQKRKDDETESSRREKEVGGFDKQIGKRMAQKRKYDEVETSRRSTNKEARRSHIVAPWLRQQKVDVRVDKLLLLQRMYNRVDTNNTLLEGRTSGHLHDYTVSSELRGPATGSMDENFSGSLAGTVGGMAMGGAGAGTSASAGGIHGGISAGTDVLQQGGHGRTLVDSTPGQKGSHPGQLYDRCGDAALYGKLASCSYAYRPSSYLEGSKGLPNGQLSDAYRPPPYLEGSVGLPNTMHTDAYTPPPYVEASMGLPNTIHSDAYRPSLYLESSTALPNTIPGGATGRSSAPGTYKVADTVTSSRLRAVDAAVSSAVSAHPSSYLY